MKSLWSDRDAEGFVARYADKGIGRDLALRVYTTRLLGGDPRLVLHGGGNTSVKTRDDRSSSATRWRCSCVKGSGWDMGDIEPQGLPAVRLAPLRALRAAATRSATRTWSTCSASTCSTRRAQPVGRDAAACLPAA